MNKVTYICKRCDRVYLSVPLSDWDKDRTKHDRQARKVRKEHKCPWERK